MRTRFAFRGWLRIHQCGDNYNALFLSSLVSPLADELYIMAGKKVTVRYWASDREKSPDDLKGDFIRRVMGIGRAEYTDHYSELTGYLGTDENLKIGGHDLMEELRTHVDEFLHLEITIHSVSEQTAKSWASRPECEV